MASEYRIHKPFVLATLPKPLDHTEGNIVAREVYGQRDGQKKRRRAELVVGVDGETTSIYDVPASRLITSYPIPPQDSFTCPPYSARVRHNGSNEAHRYTFIATRDAGSKKITLFKDVVYRDGKTTSTSCSQTLNTTAVRYLTCTSSTTQSAKTGDLIAVCEAGEVICLSGETLAVQWISSSKSMVQDVVTGTVKDFCIEYAVSGSMADFTEGIFKNRPEVFHALPKSTSSIPELVLLVSRSVSQKVQQRHLIVLAAMSSGAGGSADAQNLVPLDVVPVISETQTAENLVCQIDVQAGIMLQLQDGLLGVYDLTGAVPKLRSSVNLDHAVSFTRLSRPLILASSANSMALYNYQYRSIHSMVALDWSELPSDNQEPRTCQLISYLRSQDIAVALVDNMLVSLQVEPPKNQGKRRKEGLLIDSIGRGTVIELSNKKAKCQASSTEFSRQVLGTITESYLAKYQAETEAADKLLANNDLAGWEDILRVKFGLSLSKDAAQPNGASDESQMDSDMLELPEWNWLQDNSNYPTVVRRWVTYAISQIFSIDTAAPSDEASRQELRLVLPESNVTTYLVIAGHLNLSNLRSAFRDELSPQSTDIKGLAGDLVKCLTEADLSMTLLLNYIQATKLGEVELLLAIRALMQSIELVDGSKLLTKLLKNEAHDDKKGKESYEMDIDDLEQQIAVTEHYLGDESSIRSRGLTLAFTKLWRLPAVSTVKALRSVISTEDVMSLVYLLRVELLRGAWTALYLDPTSFDSEGNEPPPDGVIALIADLLGRCLDAVGSGGWLFNDTIAWADKADTGDFLTAVRLEVTAALEGIEEAVYLNGILGEAVRYGFAAQKSGMTRQNQNSNNPISVHLESKESRLLPLGLKTKQMPTKEKVVSGGEVVQRSVRERGHLISQNVKAYSLEKLVI